MVFVAMLLACCSRILTSYAGKKQLNQLIGFLDKGGSGKDGLGNRENSALRTVRAKRDADEAGLSTLNSTIPLSNEFAYFRSRLPERCPLVRDFETAAYEDLGRWLQGVFLRIFLAF